MRQKKDHFKSGLNCYERRIAEIRSFKMGVYVAIKAPSFVVYFNFFASKGLRKQAFSNLSRQKKRPLKRVVLIAVREGLLKCDPLNGGIM